MKNKTGFLATALTGVVFLALLGAKLIRVFAPLVILPRLDVPNLVLLSLIALVLEHYFAGNSREDLPISALFAAAAFGILPWAAGFADAHRALTLALTGGVAFIATAWLYHAACHRLSSGPAAKAAPIISAFGLYLAAQAMMGLF